LTAPVQDMIIGSSIEPIQLQYCRLLAAPS